MEQGTPKDILYEYNLSGRLMLDGEETVGSDTDIKFEAIPLVKLKLKKM